jgi:hypothetical protein
MRQITTAIIFNDGKDHCRAGNPGNDTGHNENTGADDRPDAKSCSTKEADLAFQVTIVWRLRSHRIQAKTICVRV